MLFGKPLAKTILKKTNHWPFSTDPSLPIMFEIAGRSQFICQLEAKRIKYATEMFQQIILFT